MKQLSFANLEQSRPRIPDHTPETTEQSEKPKGPKTSEKPKTLREPKTPEKPETPFSDNAGGNIIVRLFSIRLDEIDKWAPALFGFISLAQRVDAKGNKPLCATPISLQHYPMNG
ncbi:hypothetical protein F5Y09DRAFT_347452 [Xylaria sp. FL1042]|nr:hypothetical protein F5Y09DRAFT_347452 [Xylaria sp. FL1042]